MLGGWGSGKSSLLKQAYGELAEGGTESPYVCIDFSRWKYEDYEDVKAALMRAVLVACQARAAGDDDRVKEIGALRRFVRNFGVVAGQRVVWRSPRHRRSHPVCWRPWIRTPCKRTPGPPREQTGKRSDQPSQARRRTACPVLA